MALRSQRLKLVWDVAARKEQAAMDTLQAARQQLDAAEQQLHDLEDYRRQYLDGLKNSSKGPQTVQSLQSFHRFVEQLSTAIDQQQLVIQHARHAFEQARQVWLACREKSNSLKDLWESSRKEELLKAERQIDKRIEDDLNARRARSSST